ESLDNALLIEKAVQNRFEQGQRPITDVELIGATRAGAAAALAAAKRGLDYALRQLETLIGRYPDASVEIAERLPALPQAQVPAGVPADIVRRRPDLVEAERRLAAQNRRVAEAEASLYPRISLTASVGTSSDEVKDLLDGDFSVWSLAANLTAPLFQGGRLRATVDLNEASEEELRANFVGAVLNAWGEVEAALAADAFLEEQIVAMRENRTRSQSALKSADARYGQGQSDILTVLNARQTLYQAETDLVTIAAERLDARIALYVALGGGFDAETIYQSKNE
ncbi:MAG: TolC family protein, partial [Planctomycetes bacterium]|nr:TolC family protein [Planctomycetota bacterium]